MDRDTSTTPPTPPADHPEEPDRRDSHDEAIPPNPPRTQSGNFAAPKFGSAGSGGAELEPGPERD